MNVNLYPPTYEYKWVVNDPPSVPPENEQIEAKKQEERQRLGSDLGDDHPRELMFTDIKRVLHTSSHMAYPERAEVLFHAERTWRDDQGDEMPPDGPFIIHALVYAPGLPWSDANNGTPNDTSWLRIRFLHVYEQIEEEGTKRYSEVVIPELQGLQNAPISPYVYKHNQNRIRSIELPELRTLAVLVADSHVLWFNALAPALRDATDQLNTFDIEAKLGKMRV